MSDRIYNALSGEEVRKIAQEHLDRLKESVNNEASLRPHLSWPRVTIKATIEITSPDNQTKVLLTSSTDEVRAPDTVREVHDLEIPVAVTATGGRREKQIKPKNVLKEINE